MLVEVEEEAPREEALEVIVEESVEEETLTAVVEGTMDGILM